MFFFREIEVLSFFFCCSKTIRRHSTSPSDLRILNVRNGNGEDVKDARFVEVLKSAGSRIKSASKEGKNILLIYDLFAYNYLPITTIPIENICLFNYS